MIAAWNDNESSQSEEEKRENLCLMAKGDLEAEEDGENSKEVTLEHVLTVTKEYLAQSLLNCVRYE